MPNRCLSLRPLLTTLGLALGLPASPQESRPAGRPPMPFPGGPPGMGPMGQERKLVKEFDQDGNGRLDREERQAARTSARSNRPGGPRGGRMGGPGGGPGGRGEPGRPGPKVAVADVQPIPDAPLYSPDAVRTLFLEFADADWEAELQDFFHTDVEIPAALTVDGKKLPGVGVRFRGASSFFTVPAGSKRSLNLSLDFTDPKLRLHGYKTLNLLNSHEDPSFLHTVLYFDIARHYLPAPKANFVRLVINGERWKVPGSPRGAGGLEYLGEELEPYQQRYELASGDATDKKAWARLIQLCRTLCQTDLDRLEAALTPILDLDGVLWFLAIENVLVNNDGYWVRASDYALFEDHKGVFHVLPHDANETFAQSAGGPGMGGPGGRRGPGGAAPESQRGGQERGPGDRGPGAAGGGRAANLDPLVGLDDPRKPLRSRLLAVPALRARYLAHVKTLATEWLDWNKLGPIVAGYRARIEGEVEADTRKLTSLAAFQSATADELPPATESRRGASGASLRAFAERRRAFLLAHPALKD